MFIAFDTETFPIVFNGKAARLVTPRFVCLSYADGVKTALVSVKSDAVLLFKRWLEDDNITIIGHNVAYDIRVMLRAASEEGVDLWAQVFDAYEAGRVRDTRVREILIDISRGGKKPQKYSLARLEKQYLHIDRSAQKIGEDVWRLRYNELVNYPVETWPVEARTYALADAEGTLEVFKAQTREAGVDQFFNWLCEDDTVTNELPQTRADFAFGLAGSWGMAVDIDKARELDAYYQAIEDEIREELIALGYMRKSGAMNTRAIQLMVLRAWESLGKEPVLTEKGPALIAAAEKKAADLEASGQVRWEDVLKAAGGKGPREILILLQKEGFSPLEALKRTGVVSGVSTSKKSAFSLLEDAGIKDPAFQLLSRYNQAQKFRSTYLEPILDAHPYAVCPGYNVLVNSGRSSSYSPNIQNLPARGKGAEIRNCFIPRPGNAFVQCDYSTIELRTLAQVCLNLGIESNMALAIQEGRDLHLDGAAQVLHIPYERALAAYGDPEDDLHAEVKHERQVFKIANFGYPGGLGSSTFVDYAKAFGTDISPSESTKLKQTWQDKWPEMEDYFGYINANARYDGKVPIRQHGPGGEIEGWRTRLCDNYTSACNTLFQGLAADIIKHAMWQISKLAYTEPDSPLYGFRLCAMIHDELILEGPEARAEAAAKELSRLMVSAGKHFCPDVPIIAVPEIMRDKWEVE